MDELKGYLSITEGELFDSAYGLDNYLIEYDECYRKEKKCAIYFSGSGIYAPNTEEAFEQRIVKENRFEWYGHRIPGVYKHIYVRDIAKQFYVLGINKSINNMELLVEFLKEETSGMTTYTVGSSAGGYAAAVIGCMLDAKIIYCFSGFFSLNNINTDVWYLVSKYQDSEIHSRYYEVTKYLNNTQAKMIYFYPALSTDEINNDYYQHTLVANCSNVLTFPMKTCIHGITFPKEYLGQLWNKDWDQMQKINNSFKGNIDIGLFVFRCCGVRNYMEYFLKLLKEKVRDFLHI